MDYMTKALHEANSRVDERFEEQLLKRVEDALDEEGSQVYIRKTNGRLLWIKGNVHGGGQEWQELTPHLAEDRIGELRETSREESLAMLRDRLMEQEPEAYEIGWYQDTKGDLYQFDGETWLGKNPDRSEIKNLEYLGG